MFFIFRLHDNLLLHSHTAPSRPVLPHHRAKHNGRFVSLRWRDHHKCEGEEADDDGNDCNHEHE